MYKVNFYLKGATKQDFQTNSTKVFPIIISIVCSNQRWILPTGKRIEIGKWDKNKQIPKTGKSSSVFDVQLKSFLVKQKAQLEEYLGGLVPSDYVTKEDVLKALDISKKSPATTLSILLQEFLKRHKTKDGHSLRPNTVKKYKTVTSHMREFQGSDKLDLSRIDTSYYIKFKEFLSVKKGHTDNSVCKYVKAFKTFIQDIAEEKGIRIKVEFDRVKATEKLPAIHIITMEEVNSLRKHNPSTEELERAKDVFLFQCYTGQRYSDILNLRWEHIMEVSTGNWVWNLTTIKTNDILTIPLIEAAMTIIKKYSEYETPLPALSNQHFNRQLKVLATEAGLTRRVQLFEYRDGVKNVFYSSLNEIISSHMARKTFISLCLQMEIPERAVREVSGHKDEKSFKRYVQLNSCYHKNLVSVWNNSMRVN